MVNPSLLWFLPLALVPILLHLITLHRLRTVELATFRFLMDSYVQQRRRTRLLEFLVMLLRFGFVSLIVLMLARPMIKRFAFLATGNSGRDVAIIIDASPSMALQSAGTTSIQRARDAAETIIGLLGSEDHVKVIRAAGRPEVLAEGFAARPGRIIERLQDLTTDTGGADLAAALKEVFTAKAHGNRVIYVFTDGLRRTWSDLAHHPVLKHLHDQTHVVVTNVGPSDIVASVAVVGDAPGTGRVVRGLPVLLGATVLNSSTDRPADTVLSVLLDDQETDRIRMTVPPGQRVTRSFSITPTRAGVIRGRFRLPADAFPDDDEYLFCLNVEEKLTVLLVTGAKGDARAERPDLYLAAALKSPQRARSSLAAEARRLAAAIEVTAIQDEKLTEAVLNAADVVLLADVPVDANRAKLLKEFLRTGGGMLILPGSHVSPDDYAAHLLGGADDTAVRFAAATGEVEDESSFMPVAGVNLAHPVLSAFVDEEVDYFSTVRIYHYFPVELAEPSAPPKALIAADPASRPSVLMRLGNRTPILVETRLGRGKLLVAGFAATPNWSDLPLKPEFVPMLLRAVAYLQRPAQAASPAAVTPGQPASIKLTDRWAASQVQATDPAGKPHRVELQRSGRQLVGAMMQTDRKGYYTFEVLPHTDGAPERVELGFAVNLAEEQTDFAMMDEQEIREVLAGAPEMVYLRSSPEEPVLAEQLAHRREIWRTLIWATFLVVGIEFLIATLRPRRDLPSLPGAGAGSHQTSGMKHWTTLIRHTLGAAPGGAAATLAPRASDLPPRGGRDEETKVKT